MKGYSTLIAAALCVLLGLPSASRCPGRLLRPQQGPVPEVRLQGPEDRALRHLLLPGGRGGRRAWPRGWPSAGTRGSSQLLGPRAQRPAAAHPLRQPPALPADQRDRRRHRRGHRRRHRGAQAPHRAAVRRPARRDRPRARPRARARVPVRHHRQRQRRAPATAGALRLPLWFIEGMAEYLSIGPVDPHTAMWMRDAARREKLPTIDELDNPKYFPYRYGQALWAYIAGTLRRRVGRPTCCGRRRAATRPIRRRSRRCSAIDTKELSTQWHDAEFAALRADRSRRRRCRRRSAEPLITKSKTGGDLNVGPALSPDGRADRLLLREGPVLDRPVPGRRRDRQGDPQDHRHRDDPHFESLQFLTSAGAWDPTASRFVVPGAVRRASRCWRSSTSTAAGREREIRLDEVDEILNPTWSPDGKQIAFSALIGGFTDLYRLRSRHEHAAAPDERRVRRARPAWSPDGTRIAFATDRFTTNLDDARAGDLPARRCIDSTSGAVHRARRLRGRQEHQPAVDRGRRSRLLPLRPRRHHQHLPR